MYRDKQTIIASNLDQPYYELMHGAIGTRETLSHLPAVCEWNEFNMVSVRNLGSIEFGALNLACILVASTFAHKQSTILCHISGKDNRKSY